MRSVVGKTSRDQSSLFRSSILTGQSWIGSIYLVVPKVSFLGVGDPKVPVLGTGDGGKRQGGARELECMEEMEDSEEMDIGCGIASLVIEVLSDRLHVRDRWIKSGMVAMWKW